MRLPVTFKALSMLLPLWLALFALDAHAAIDNADVLDSVLTRYQTAASGWAATIINSASWLFWLLVVISMVWTFGMMALRKADIGEFFAEFVRFTIFTGFFWWLLTNGPNFAKSIMDSLRQIGGNATGLGIGLSPSGIVDVGFEIFDKVIDQSSLWSPVNSAVGISIAAAILVILALVGVNMLLLLVSGWILAYAGIFFLGFGGSRWTSDMAINYYKTVLGVAAQLLAMVLIVGIGKTFLDGYYGRMSESMTIKEMGVMLIVSVILLSLVNKLPSLVSGIIIGASVGHAGIGNFGAGAAVGAAGMAAAAAATGGAMLAVGAANAAGGAQAVMAAFSKASENVQSGADAFTSMWAGGGPGGGGGSGKGEESTGSTPFAQAAGFASSGSVQALRGSSAARAEGQDWDAKGKEEGKSDQGQGKASESKANAGTGGAGKAEGGPQRSSGGLRPSAGKAGLFAADAAANLAKGTAQVAKEKMAGIRDAAMDRIAETTGGKIAAAIKAGSAKDEAGSAIESMPTFGGNNLAGASTSDVDTAAEVAAFANRATKFV
ncbi:TrbL protein of DNA transfer system (plasmid) [Aromatoleum aromaticum EbN1]|uniref:TrbL protein of DNA transfer system n=1 Tax=Aromatoleum aromaticum (strain DSM 19018 / LMG 30748 / EbN1) TaxID=76114 RepID=Q5NWL6_AROAE|nr:P-type conjugative transfer protein TrbL [Aromatoleum aromaticum]CAI10548.1 TrbL protein of DNA transfer system [Aromatoleum aromaticum EbN1]